MVSDHAEDRPHITEDPEGEDGRTPTRRQTLAAGGLVLAGVVTGCQGFITDRSGTTTPTEFDHLDDRPIYVDEALDLTVPEAVQVVSEPEDADLILLSDDPDAGPEEAVDWLSDRRAIGLLGDDAQDTWLSWVDSQPYHDAFDPNGVAEGEPAPDLVISWHTGNLVTTRRYGWDRGPDDGKVLTALDESLTDIGQPTGEGSLA
jgi:hypothetical protein